LKTAPTYSLLVPCYNAQKYIDGFIANISKLSTPFDEVLFYDDASIDNTSSILKSKGYKVIKGDINKGPSYARNRLAEIAICEYIHFHDIDDEFNPAFLELINNKLNLTPADVVLGNADWIDALTKTSIINWQYNANEIVKDAFSYFIAHPLGVINTVYKKDIFLQVNGFNESLNCWEDADLHIRLGAAGYSFAVINEVLAYSLRHNNGISKDQLWCWNCRLKFIESYLIKYPNLNRKLIEDEIKKVQNFLIASGSYKNLGYIINLKKIYNLQFKASKILILYYLNKVFPASIINKILRSTYLKNS
jgi:glycosyltransferase involved in cell wall biosynthesis